MSTYQEPPPLPPSPTILRKPPNAASSSSPSPPPPPPPPPPAGKLPPPPRFPSMKDVTPPSPPPSTTAAETPALHPAPPLVEEDLGVAWHRPPSLSPPSQSHTSLPEHGNIEEGGSVVGGVGGAVGGVALSGGVGSAPHTPTTAGGSGAAGCGVGEAGAVEGKGGGGKGGVVGGLMAKVRAVFAGGAGRKKEVAVAGSEVVVGKEVGKKSAMDKVKKVVCGLPDPTLGLLLNTALILVVHTVKPGVLQGWGMRVVLMGIQVALLGLVAVWRRTVVVDVVEGPGYVSRWRAIPNAQGMVKRGEMLRRREREVRRREEEVKKGAFRLEMLRREIKARLPPQIRIQQMLEMEQRAA